MPKYFLVKVEAYEGDQTSYVLYNKSSPQWTKELYSIGMLTDQNIITLIDNGYSSAEEARRVWPQVEEEWELG